jgi:hypothetical protein
VERRGGVGYDRLWTLNCAAFEILKMETSIFFETQSIRATSTVTKIALLWDRNGLLVMAILWFEVTVCCTTLHHHEIMSSREFSGTFNTPSKTARRKKASSPFLVNQLADSERIENRNRAQVKFAEQEKQNRRHEEEATLKREMRTTTSAKNNEMEYLRKARREILAENQIIKARISVEKTNGHRKEDRQAAQRALNARLRKAKASLVEKTRERIREERQMEREILMRKHGLTPHKGAKESEWSNN